MADALSNLATASAILGHAMAEAGIETLPEIRMASRKDKDKLLAHLKTTETARMFTVPGQGSVYPAKDAAARDAATDIELNGIRVTSPD